MRDQKTIPSAERMLSRTNSRDELIDLAKEYFEIAVGIRRPTEKEQDDATRLTLQGIFGTGVQYEDQIRILKYPLTPSISFSYRTYLELEYEVFRILSTQTTLADGPYIPMLRYELDIQEELLEEDELEYALFRQYSCFETIFRAKLGVGHVRWKYAVLSAYWVLDLFGETELSDLRDLKDTRNEYAHDWRTRFLEGQEERLRETVRKGLRVLSFLLSQELYLEFKEHSTKHHSKRLSTNWDRRATSVLSTNSATPSYEAPCPNCGKPYNPKNHFKRCPECDSPHDFWKA